MYSGVYAPNRPFTPDDKRLLTLAHPQAAVLRYESAKQHTHTRADSDWLHSIFCSEQVVVINPDRIDFHYEDIEAAAAEFGASVKVQTGNEPDQTPNTRINQPKGGFSYNLPQMWQHRYYLLLALANRHLYPYAQLLSPPLSCTPRDMSTQRSWLTTMLGSSNLQAVYNQFDGISVHAYDWYDSSELLRVVDEYHTIFPTKDLYVTEYGIDDTKTISMAEKVARYCAFIAACRTRPYVKLTAMFIAGVGLPGGFEAYEAGDAIAGLAGV